MSQFQLGPRLEVLQPRESFAKFETWRQNILYHLSQNAGFQAYLTVIFGKKTRAKPNRDLKTDLKPDGDVDPSGKSAATKCIQVDMMMEQISNWCLNVVPRNDITRDCESIDAVWQKLRLFYNMETTGSLLNDTWGVVREPDETPQALYSRLKQLYDDNLLKKDGLKHVDGRLEEDEDLSPTLHNTIVLQWMNILHPKLRDTVTQRFTTELRDSTYARLFPEISRCVNELVAGLNSGDTVCRTYGYNRFNGGGRGREPYRGCDNYRGRGQSSYRREW